MIVVSYYGCRSYTGTQVHLCTVTQVYRYTGKQVHRNKSTQVHRYTGAQVPRYTGTKVNKTQVNIFTHVQR